MRHRALSLLLFVLTLSSTHVFANVSCDIAVGGTPEAVKRIQQNPYLKSLLEKGVSGPSRNRLVVNHDALAAGLRHEGMPEADVQAYLSGIKTTMQLALEKNVQALLPAVTHINRVGGESPANRNLLVCTVPAGCSINAKFFGNLSTITAYDMKPVNFSWGDLPSIPSQSTERVDGLIRDEVMFLSQYRVIPGADEVPHLAEWQAQFFRDVTLSANFELLSKWIKSNSKSGGNPLFNSWVSIKNGHITLDKSFYAVFALSRSNAAYFQALKLVLEEFTDKDDESRSFIKRIELQIRANTVIEITQMGGVEAIRKFGVTEANVLEVGSQLAKIIEDTTR